MHRTAEAIIEIGGVGRDIEDTANPSSDGDYLLLPVEQAAGKIPAVRDGAGRAGVELVINARTDASWSTKWTTG